MMTTTTAQHTCFGKVFCGFPREIAKAECPVCTCPHNEVAFNAKTVWCETCGATLTTNEG